jgi:hypothetical protein
MGKNHAWSETRRKGKVSAFLQHNLYGSYIES